MIDPAEQTRRDADRLQRYCLHIAKQGRRVRVISNSASCSLIVEEGAGIIWKPIRTITQATSTLAIDELVGKMRYDESKKAYV